MSATKRQWFAGAWALLGAPAAIVLMGYSEKALFTSVPNSVAFLAVGACIPGACIGLGLLALLSLVKPGWPKRAIIAAIYGTVMLMVAETAGNPVLATHAAVVELPE